MKNGPPGALGEERRTAIEHAVSRSQFEATAVCSSFMCFPTQAL